LSKYLILLVFVLALVLGASANLSASPIILALNAEDGRRGDILVGNTGDRTQYLNITALKIQQPGHSPEQYLRSPSPSEIGLLVAPRRLVLQPGEEKIIRVILLQETIPKDLAWRVRIEPAIGDVTASQPVAVTHVTYDALVFARPSDPVAKIIGERDGNRLNLRNEGTSNALLHSGEQCLADTDCVAVAGKRLWPGMSWTIELDHSAPVSFVERGPGEERILVY
jgi:P pilus assembly chaperone PapD